MKFILSFLILIAPFATAVAQHPIHGDEYGAEHAKPDQKEPMDTPQRKIDKELKRKGHGPKSPEKMSTDKKETTEFNKINKEAP
ncbi:hypothetical protein [Bdellovibrio sp. HCB274]|uniref:hypothetical protein n=1 Tax=Bdellovibrio sp. HCB274 TaxID=3394361 RepID=UPI0039B4AC79